MASEIESDFAAAMQELSVRASDDIARRDAQISASMASMISAVHSLGQRVESLEESVMRNFESMHFQRLEEQITALRESETVNQKLFDSLHEELISYRDNFMRDALQKPVIRELIVLFDDLSRIVAQLETAEGVGPVRPQVRDNVSNTLHFLVEILHRLEVVEIETIDKVDRQLHRVITVEPAETPEQDDNIVRRLKRGFTWHGKVFRPEEVVAQRFYPPTPTEE